MKRFLVLFLGLSMFNMGAFAQTTKSVMHIDLRDHVRYNKADEYINSLPSFTVLRAMRQFPSQFFGKAVAGSVDSEQFNRRIKLSMRGPIGPTGYTTERDGKKIFQVSETNQHTRTNTVFGVEYERVEVLGEGRFRTDVVALVHDSTYADDPNGFYFRRMSLLSDYAIDPKQKERVVVVDGSVQDIPLSRTQISVKVDLLQRKIITKINVPAELVQPGKSNQIIKVYPVAVGGFDIRTREGMDNKVELMTHEFVDNAVLTADPVEGVIGRSSNTRQRVYPSYYKGRPFIALFDQGGKKYREIAFHYQIDKNDIKRGFVSHGCMRVRDKDLYELETFVFLGGQQNVPVEARHQLEPEYAELEHPKPQLNSYYYAIGLTRTNYLADYDRTDEYTRRDIASYEQRDPSLRAALYRYIWCRYNGKNFSIRNGGNYGNYYSVLDSDCLTRTYRFNKSPDSIIDFMLGRSDRAPLTPLVNVSREPVDPPEYREEIREKRRRIARLEREIRPWRSQMSRIKREMQSISHQYYKRYRCDKRDRDICDRLRDRYNDLRDRFEDLQDDIRDRLEEIRDLKREIQELRERGRRRSDFDRFWR